MYFATQRPEAREEGVQVVELEMPIDDYWKALDIINEITFLQASGEPPSELSTRLKQVFKLSAPHAVFEKHRTWLIEKVNE